MFNARCEGLARSPAFRGPFASQRGIVPMSSFIEWRGARDQRQPWLVTTADEALAVAALWDSWQGAGRDRPLLSCTLVTTEAAEPFKPWHARMPVLLAPTECDRWLDNGERIHGDDGIFAPVLKQPLRLVPLDRRVGNSRNKDPALLDAHGDWVELDSE
jgi:putative SOS response-associated peptidase YedK